MKLTVTYQAECTCGTTFESHSETAIRSSILKHQATRCLAETLDQPTKDVR